MYDSIMNQYDTIPYSKSGFDNEKYRNLQSDEIVSRKNCLGGRLYLEVGGKFLFDAHAARVLPGFDPENKTRILGKFKGKAELLFCVNAQDILQNRMLSNTAKGYVETTLEMIKKFGQKMEIKPRVVINLVKQGNEHAAKEYSDMTKELGYSSYTTSTAIPIQIRF